MPNTKPTLAETLQSMPDVGKDSDFARVEDGEDKRLAARQMQNFMTTAPSVDLVDLKALIEDGRAGDVPLESMIDQMSKAKVNADAEIDEPLAESDASNQRIESIERKTHGKASE